MAQFTRALCWAPDKMENLSPAPFPRHSSQLTPSFHVDLWGLPEDRLSADPQQARSGSDSILHISIQTFALSADPMVFKMHIYLKTLLNAQWLSVIIYFPKQRGTD